MNPMAKRNLERYLRDLELEIRTEKDHQILGPALDAFRESRRDLPPMSMWRNRTVRVALATAAVLVVVFGIPLRKKGSTAVWAVEQTAVRSPNDKRESVANFITVGDKMTGNRNLRGNLKGLPCLDRMKKDVSLRNQLGPGGIRR